MSYETTKNKWLNWYKNYYGAEPTEGFSRTEGMSDKDYETGNALFGAYLDAENVRARQSAEQKAADDAYRGKIAAVDAAEREQRQLAEVTYGRLMKYVPDMLKAAGLTAGGLSETSYIAAENTLKTDLNAATQAADAQRRTVTGEYDAANEKRASGYITKQAELLTQLNDKESDIGRYYDEKAAEERQAAFDNEIKKAQTVKDAEESTAETQRKMFSAVLNSLYDGEGKLIFKSAESFKKYAEGLKGKLGSYYGVLLSLAESYGEGEGASNTDTSEIEERINGCTTSAELESYIGTLTEAQQSQYSQQILLARFKFIPQGEMPKEVIKPDPFYIPKGAM